MRLAVAISLLALLAGCAGVDGRVSPTPTAGGTPEAGSCPQEGFTCVRGIVTRDTGAPFPDVCVVVGAAGGCSARTGPDGGFAVNLTRDAAVTWTIYFEVGSAVLATRQLAGPLLIERIDLGTIGLPSVLQ
jgi:hypothetical protein